MGAAKSTEPLRAGKRAPVFRLTDLENGNVEMNTLWKDGPVLLAFFKSTCPVCQMTLPLLDRIHEGGSGAMRIYGVSQDDAETTREFAAEFGLHLPVLLDTEESGYPASNAYGLSHVPTMFLVERDGAISWSGEGFHKREFEALANQAGVNPFRPGENIPEWKAG